MAGLIETAIVNRGRSAISCDQERQERNVTHSLRALAVFAGVAVAGIGAGRAEGLATYALTLKNHHFTPTEIHAPTGKPLFVSVQNLANSADEFELHNPAIEKVIPAGQDGKVRISPLGPGRFAFLGDLHQDSAPGAIISE